MARSYRYYDTPDGQDLFPKIEYLCRRVAQGSFPLALFDVALITKPKSYFSIAERYFRVALTPLAATTVWATTVYLSTKLRKKDDSYNHVIGGLVTACYLNKHYKNTPIIWVWTLPAILMLIGYKEVKMSEGSKGFHEDKIDATHNQKGCVINYDFERQSMYNNKDSLVWKIW